MKADQIFKNAKIFTADSSHPQAAALAVKDGKFVYVGDEAGLSEYEGEVTDLGGKFIMPGIIDSHVHVTLGVGFDYADPGTSSCVHGKRKPWTLWRTMSRTIPAERLQIRAGEEVLNGEDDREGGPRRDLPGQRSW